MSGADKRIPGEADARSSGKPKGGEREAIIDALMNLAARRDFGDIAISDVAREAGVSLADFRDAFPSKGAVVGAFSRRIDRKVLDNLSNEYDAEPARERLYHVLAKRLDALEPYRDAVLGIADWAEKEPLAASALNRETVNSMRFMLEAADIDSEGAVGALKLQGLALAWRRVIEAWRKDRLGEHSHALTALDRELMRGEKWIDRAEDIARTTEPFRALAHRLFEGWSHRGERMRERHGAEHDHDHPHAGA
jgi:AcrR family transcriptional regulator